MQSIGQRLQFADPFVPVLDAGHGTLFADTVVGIFVALVVFALYYVFVLQRARGQ